jgi:molybdopterin converting factor small subunit
MIRVSLEVAFSFKRELGDDWESLELPEDADVEAAILRLAARNSTVRSRLLDAAGRPQPHIDALVNGVNVRSRRGLHTRLRDGDRLTLLPPVGGG